MSHLPHKNIQLSYQQTCRGRGAGDQPDLLLLLLLPLLLLLQCMLNENVLSFIDRNATGYSVFGTKLHATRPLLGSVRPSVRPSIHRRLAGVTQNLSKSEMGLNRYHKCQTSVRQTVFATLIFRLAQSLTNRLLPGWACNPNNNVPGNAEPWHGNKSHETHMRIKRQKTIPKHQSQPHVEMILISTASIWKIKTLRLPLQEEKKKRKEKNKNRKFGPLWHLWSALMSK